jgi:hypothetical protein
MRILTPGAMIFEQIKSLNVVLQALRQPGDPALKNFFYFVNS